MDKKLLVTLIAYLFVLLILYLLFRIFTPFLTSFAWALIIGITTRPLYRKILGLFKGRKTAAAAVMTFLAVVAIIIPVLAGVYLVMEEATTAYHYVSQSGKTGPAYLDELMQKPAIAALKAKIEPHLASVDLESLKAHAMEKGKKFAEQAASSLAYSAKHLIEIFGHLLFILFFLFFIYKDGDRLHSVFWLLVPIEEETKNIVTTTTHKALAAFVFGVLLTALAQALVAWVGYIFARLPSPFFFAVLTAMAGFIPGIGTILVWVPCVAFLALTGKTTAAIALAVWNLVMIVAVVDHFVRPAVMGRLINLPIALILVGGLGGIFAFGMLGMVVGPLILSLIYALVQERIKVAERQHVGEFTERTL